MMRQIIAVIVIQIPLFQLNLLSAQNRHFYLFPVIDAHTVALKLIDFVAGGFYFMGL